MAAKAECVGKGSYGVVMLRKIGQEEFAIKLETDHYSYRHCTGIANIREIDACQRVNNHPSIVTTYHKKQRNPIIIPKKGEHSFMEICMEVANGDLFTFISSMDRKRPKEILEQSLTIVMHVLLGLEWMKAKGIVHRDISLANILFDKERSKEPTFFIADFGSFENIGNSPLPAEKDEMTTAWYRSPEAALHIANDDRVDVWSIGCILFELLTRELFLRSPELRSIPTKNSDIAILKSIVATSIEEIPPEFIDKVPSEVRRVKKMKNFRERLCLFEGEEDFETLIDFFKILLKINFHERATATEALAHPMILKNEARASYIKACREEFPPTPPVPSIVWSVDDHISVKKGALCSIVLEALSSKKPWTSSEHKLAIAHGIDVCLRYMNSDNQEQHQRYPFSDETLLLLCVYICHKYFTPVDYRLTWNAFSKGSGIVVAIEDVKRWEFEIISSSGINFVVFKEIEVEEKTIEAYLRAFQLTSPRSFAPALQPSKPLSSAPSTS